MHAPTAPNTSPTSDPTIASRAATVIALAALALAGVLAVASTAHAQPATAQRVAHTTSPASAQAPAQGPAQAMAQAMAKKNKPCITRAEYLHTKKGMTLTRAGKIIGTQGRIAIGDIASHIRVYVSCVPVGLELLPVCMRYTRKELPNGTWSVARLADKNVDCPPTY